MPSTEKQLTLKPQDVVVVVMLAIHRNRDLSLSILSDELGMSPSTVHDSILRAEIARLISRSSGSIRAITSSVREFVIHGVRYAFPAVLGTSARGIPTSIGAPILRDEFDPAKLLPPVWPTPQGKLWGPAITPLHSAVPKAALKDEDLYAALALIDALRTGAAREREMAEDLLRALL